VLYHRIPSIEGVDALAAERGYKNRDEIVVSPQTMGDAYEAKVKAFFHEHLHEDEEIRYVRDGRGYFDVRDKGDRWVRILLEKVCLILLFLFFLLFSLVTLMRGFLFSCWWFVWGER
jgi:1,2-dihydroxy-3-keto-5-methylthiopentene dioxygenase